MDKTTPPEGYKPFDLEEALRNCYNVVTRSGRKVISIEQERPGKHNNTLKVRFADAAGTFRYNTKGHMLAPANVEPYQLFLKK